jgi:hypothetical protein
VSLPEHGRGGWGGARRLAGERVAEVGEDGPHDGGVLHGGDDPLPGATAGRSGWAREPWSAVQRAAWEALRRREAEVA